MDHAITIKFFFNLSLHHSKSLAAMWGELEPSNSDEVDPKVIVDSTSPFITLNHTLTHISMWGNQAFSKGKSMVKNTLN